MLADLQREVARGMQPVTRRSVGSLLDAWLEDRKASVRPSTWERYEELVHLHLTPLKDIAVGLLTPDDIRACTRDLTPTVNRGALRILKAALQVAVNDGLLPRNVAASVTPAKKPGQAGRALTDAETTALLSVARKHDLWALWALYIDTGIRMGEGLGLRWTDVDLAERQIAITGSVRHQPAKLRGSGLRLQRVDPKTAAGRRFVPLTERAVEGLSELPKSALYVFHRRGKPLNPSTVQRHFALLCEEAKLGHVRLHDLRHSFITRALAHGASLDDVRRLAGHSSIRVTADQYAHRVESRLREAVRNAGEAVG